MEKQLEWFINAWAVSKPFTQKVKVYLFLRIGKGADRQRKIIPGKMGGSRGTFTKASRLKCTNMFRGFSV